MLRRLLLAVSLLVAAPAAGAWADTAQTERAEQTANGQQARVQTLATQRAALAARYAEELRDLDKLKKQRASWRRDRDIENAMSASLETAKQLGAVTRDLATAETALATARRDLLAAVDSERPTATGPRAARLAQLHDQLAPSQKARAKKIRIPNADIDPLADPEELDEQAQALRDSEAELNRQVANLDTQAVELDRVATLKKQHERAGELGTRDDDASRHSAQHPSGVSSTKETANGGGDHSNPAPGGTGGAGAGGGSGSTGGGGSTTLGGADQTSNPQTPTSTGGGGSTYETDATVVLSDVVDAHTIDSLQKAQRSGDPAVRAAAARQARDAVAARLARLKAQRTAVEARAKQLRAH